MSTGASPAPLVRILHFNPVNISISKLKRADSQRHTPSPGSSQSTSAASPSQPDQPSSATLVIGNSFVRHVKSRTSTTHCYPGAKVRDIIQKIPALVSKHPHAKNFVLHIGTNNMADCKSEILKHDFISLFNLLKDCNKSVLISRVIPTYHRGIGCFSRLLSFNTWLQSVCSSHNTVFIDNFNLFCERAPFFIRDGIHPSR